MNNLLLIVWNGKGIITLNGDFRLNDNLKIKCL